MIFKRFRYRLVIRVVLLAATLLATLYLFLETEYYISQFFLAALCVVQVVMLIRFQERTNQDLTRFLNAIRYSDFTGSFQHGQSGSYFDELNKAFNEVIEKFRSERSKSEESLRYLETVVEHVAIGLICLRSNGEVILVNRAAKRLFGIHTLRSLQALEALSDSLRSTVESLDHGGRSLLRVQLDGEEVHLAIHATEFRMRGEGYKLVSFQNIRSELEEKEMESWQNITQVLAHEIMNSITPIASLSETIHMLLQQQLKTDGESVEIDNETIQDVDEALQTISRRSQGLMRFVDSYRDFTQIPKPEKSVFEVKGFLQKVVRLMQAEFKKYDVETSVEVVPENLRLYADPELIEQALINITKNAIRAVQQEEEPKVGFRATIRDERHVCIDVMDNGPGIKKEDLEKIFIPFFSTARSRKGGGSGIGLSLSRQIMRGHGGGLQAQSDPGKQTVFTLRF